MDPSPTAQPSPSAFRGLAQTLVHYIETRLRLAQIESREAASHLIGIACLLTLLLGSLLVAWIIALPALIWIIAQQFAWHWSRVALATAAIHLLLSLIALISLKRRLRQTRLFEESLHQFQLDREWLAPRQN
jgi:uncharacterized membrane protein YqjE